MGTNRPAAGGGRTILVEPERLGRWLDGFDRRHQVMSMTVTEHGVRAEAADSAVAQCSLPLGRELPPGAPAPHPEQGWGDLLDFVVEHASVPSLVGVVMARRAAIAVGVFTGTRLLVSKVDTSYVQGRTAAGGWSQQRYARRRVNQAKAAAGKAADIVYRVIGPHVERLDAVVTAGDKETIAAIFEEPRLESVAGLVVEHIGDVPEPRLAALQALPERYRCVHIHLDQPEGT